MKNKIGTTEEELAACRAAFAACPDAKFAWCCHHEILVEPLMESPEARITYILEGKPGSEQARRFFNFRPVRVELPKAYVEARKAYVEARKAYSEAGKAYIEAGKAYIEAQQASEKLLRGLHTQDWPENTRNGSSIFI